MGREEVVEVIQLNWITSITSKPWATFGDWRRFSERASSSALLANFLWPWLVKPWIGNIAWPIFFFGLFHLMGPLATQILWGQIRFGGLLKKIDAGATSGPKANVSILTFHYRQILQWPCGLVGLCWLWNKVGAESGSKHLVKIGFGLGGAQFQKTWIFHIKE